MFAVLHSLADYIHAALLGPLTVYVQIAPTFDKQTKMAFRKSDSIDPQLRR